MDFAKSVINFQGKMTGVGKNRLEKEKSKEIERDWKRRMTRGNCEPDRGE